MAKEQILIIDDEEIIHTGLKRELGQEGYEVDGALDGDQAVEMVKAKKYDLIFVDFMMPTMDGIETCKAIKKISPDSVLIFMTGKLDKDTVWKEVAFQDAGGKLYYLYKPFHKNEILEVAKKALAQRG
jgi:DNA-binding response OmpR family regulator